MILLLLISTISSINDDDPLISQSLVDHINNNPNSTMKAWLNPRFSNMTIGEMKRLLSPVRKIPHHHGSPKPIGSNEAEYNHLKTCITGYLNPHCKLDDYKLKIYNNKYLCTSWATAITSAMSLSLSIHANENINLSLQYSLDCDVFGDPCKYRPPLSAYQPFVFRTVPYEDSWDQPNDIFRQPPKSLNKDYCDQPNSCFPNWDSCVRTPVMTGECSQTNHNIECPVYPLNHWKRMKSFLWEVGPITSTITVTPAFFAHSEGVLYDTSDEYNEELGSLDVTIIGWGEEKELTGLPTDKWWYVIPHLGTDFGEKAKNLFPNENETFRLDVLGYSDLERKTGIVRIARRMNMFGIEENAFGGVPYNFRPRPIRTPKINE